MRDISRDELKDMIMKVLLCGPLKEVEMRIDELVMELIPDADDPNMVGYTGPIVEE